MEALGEFGKLMMLGLAGTLMVVAPGIAALLLM